jgi:hypothetical protein
MKGNWKKFIWEFIKKFPAVSYGLVSFLLFLFLGVMPESELVSVAGVVFIIFTPPILISGGLSNLFFNHPFSFFDEIAPLILVFAILFLLDLVSILMRRFLSKCFGETLFIKIVSTLITVSLCGYIFLMLISNLPIDI